LRLLILVAREGFLKDKCGPRAKRFEHHCSKYWQQKVKLPLSTEISFEQKTVFS